jgi:hypothetical protein
MAEVFMKKNLSPRSPRVRAHPLKSIKGSQTMRGMSKKALSKKKMRQQYNQYYFPDDMDDDGMNNMMMDDPDEIGTYRSLNDNMSAYSQQSLSQRSVGQLMKVRLNFSSSTLQF